MEVIIALLLAGVGLALIFYLRPKLLEDITEIKYLKTKTIAELNDMFTQMENSGLGNEYREFVELKGIPVSDNLVVTPFSDKKVVYCESKLIQVTQVTENYRDSNGMMRTRVRKQEIPISNEKSSQYVLLKDNSSQTPVALEVTASGCDLDIPKSWDRFEPKSNLGHYRYFNSFNFGRFGAETLGFKMVEKTINENQSLYVIGEAFKEGNQIHIGKPRDEKKPFIITTKSEEDLVNTSKQKSTMALVGGIIFIVIGIIMIIFKMKG